jgi:hypothetical protein
VPSIASSGSTSSAITRSTRSRSPESFVDISASRNR